MSVGTGGEFKMHSGADMSLTSLGGVDAHVAEAVDLSAGSVSMRSEGATNFLSGGDVDAMVDGNLTAYAAGTVDTVMGGLSASIASDMAADIGGSAGLWAAGEVSLQGAAGASVLMGGGLSAMAGSLSMAAAKALSASAKTLSVTGSDSVKVGTAGNHFTPGIPFALDDFPLTFLMDHGLMGDRGSCFDSGTLVELSSEPSQRFVSVMWSSADSFDEFAVQTPTMEVRHRGCLGPAGGAPALCNRRRSNSSSALSHCCTALRVTPVGNTRCRARLRCCCARTRLRWRWCGTAFALCVPPSLWLRQCLSLRPSRSTAGRTASRRRSKSQPTTAPAGRCGRKSGPPVCR